MFFFTLGCKPHNPNRVEKPKKNQMAFSCAIGATVWLKISCPEVKKGETLLLGAPRENPADEGENPADEGYEPKAG